MNRKQFITTSAKATLALGLSNYVFSKVNASTAPAPFTVNGDLGNIKLFPSNNHWNTPIAGLKKDVRSDKMIVESFNGNNCPPTLTIENTLPYNVINDVEPAVLVTDRYISNTGPAYRFPIMEGMIKQCGEFINPPAGGYQNDSADGRDHHLIIIDTVRMRLYELYQPFRKSNGDYECFGSAIFDLRSNDPRLGMNYTNAQGMTSSDAAGLPILPGLLRYDELISDEPIRHALRMTVKNVRKNEIWHPATHTAGGLTGKGIPMGARLRLKSTYSNEDMETNTPPGISRYKRKIIQCLKEYGAIVADNGTYFAISGANDCRFVTEGWCANEPDHCGSSANLCNVQSNLCIFASDLEVIDHTQIAAL